MNKIVHMSLCFIGIAVLICCGSALSTEPKEGRVAVSLVAEADKEAYALFKKLRLGMGRGQVEKILGPSFDKGSSVSSNVFWYIPNDTKIDEWLLADNKGKIAIEYKDNVIAHMNFGPEALLLENLDAHRQVSNHTSDGIRQPADGSPKPSR